MSIWIGYDSFGIQGSIFHYSLAFALVGSTLLLLFYFWYNGRLDSDEGPKMQMMQIDDKEIEMDNKKNFPKDH